MKQEDASRSLLDRAFQLARRNLTTFPGPANVRTQLAIEFSEISANPYAQEFFDAYDRALALLREAELLADQLRDGRITRAVAMERLQLECAGFEPSTCDDAIAEGLFRTR